MRRRLLSFSGATVAVLAFAGFSGHHQVTATVTPGTSAWDQPIDIRVTGLDPGRSVKIAMHSVDADGAAFVSEAVFRADRAGTVDLERTAPAASNEDGIYRTVWPTGLLDTMAPPGGGHPYVWALTKPRVFEITVSAGDQLLAGTTFRRGFGYPTPIHTRSLTVARDGIVGTYAAPTQRRRGPAVLVFGGSEGGPGHAVDAARFASDGVPALAIGYFGAPGVPRELKNIPLEYFRHALEWLDRQPGVDPRQVTVIGTSRGGEAALLLGVHYPDLVHGVVSLVGSDYVVCGVVAFHPDCIGPAWTLGGKPLPYVSRTSIPPAARIPIARIHGPILLSCAVEDHEWNSCGYAQNAEQELMEAHFPYRHPLYTYRNAGHFGAQIGAYEPGAQLEDDQVPANERAREDLWPKLLAFVRSV